jgi:hypothetical protein
MEAVADNLTTQLSKYHETKGFPLYTFQYDASTSTIYVVDSENNPVDTMEHKIEIYIVNNSDRSTIISDKDKTDGGYTDGLLYTNQEIPCEKQPEENECEAVSVQGWELNGSDFSNMSVSVYFNESKFQNNYSSVEEMVGSLNERALGVGIGRTFEVHNNIIYISNTDTEPFNSEKDYLELFIVNNNDESYIVRESDDGKDKGSMYSIYDISDCGQAHPAPEENECEAVSVQGWILNGEDFNDISVGGSETNLHSKEELLDFLNKTLSSERRYDRNFDIKDDILYIVDSDINPVEKNQYIELSIYDNKSESRIIQPSDEDSGKDKGGLMYSIHDISDCTVVPPAENECEVAVVQGWTLEGEDFSNMTIHGSYGKEADNFQIYSKEEILTYLNGGGHSFVIGRTFAIKDDILYIVDSENDPVDSEK